MPEVRSSKPQTSGSLNMSLEQQILTLSRQSTMGGLSPLFQDHFTHLLGKGDFPSEEALLKTQHQIIEYLHAYKMQAGVSDVVLGMSGGVDSALAAALFKRAGWTVHGYTLPIEQDPEEQKRGIEACDALRLNHTNIDLTDQYLSMVGALGDATGKELALGDTAKDRIRRGNIRARLRMTALYDQAQRVGGLVASTDNFSELTAGFWTLHGDVGDLSPIQALTKSWEVPWMAKSMDVPESIWKAKPTDGLGIDDGDEAQIGMSYMEWDILLLKVLYEYRGSPWDREAMEKEMSIMPKKRTSEHTTTDDRKKIGLFLNRISGTWFKRHNPICIPGPATTESRLNRLSSLDRNKFWPKVVSAMDEK